MPRLFVVLLPIALAGACADEDAEDTFETPPDAVSSASPQRDSSILSDAHPGYGDPACWTCHADPHQGGFALGECVTCHGANGAPRRPAGHANDGCIACHASFHADLKFRSPDHCRACHKFEPGVPCPVTETVDAVVIGAGGGGLGAAAMLARGGMSVAVIEKQYKVGGYMTRFHRGDYTFEASLHAMGGLDPYGVSRGTVETFEKLGILDRVRPVRSDPMYRSVFPGLTIDVPDDADAYAALLKSLYPHESAGIDALFAEMKLCDELLRVLMRIGSDFGLADLWKLLRNLGAVLRGLGYVNMTLDEAVSQFVSDPRLKGVFHQLVTYVGGGPSELQAIYFMTMWGSYHLGGFHYFVGGSQAVSEAMADVVREHGGSIYLNTLATGIDVEGGRATRVRTLDDACFDARWVVSNANAPDTLLRLVGEDHLPADYVEKLKTMEVGLGTLQVFVGVDHDYREFFPGTHELMINEAYDQDENFRYVRAADLAKVPYIITNYSVVDPGVAPAGKNAISLTTFLPFDLGDQWGWNGRYADYDAFRRQVAQVLLDRAEAYLPGLRDHIEVLEIGTPVTNYAYSLNPAGTIFGWSNTPAQGTIRRLKQKTPIENLLLAGAWTFPGGGQSAVISSGVTAAETILEAEGR
jgi:prolycopene isomerase